MELSHSEPKTPSRIGDRNSSDVIVRIRTHDGRDDRIYCHSHILINNSKYFADRLSDNWPTCQILDSRNCVDVHCQECDFDYHVTILRLFYINSDVPMSDLWHGVKNALGILRVAVELECPKIVSTCVEYLEAVPWEEAEEEEILKIIPSMGAQAEPVLARLKPVNPLAIVKIFRSAIRFATSSPSSSFNDLKTSAQEQLEYMLTEDDDAPLLTADDDIKLDVRHCISQLTSRFVNLVHSLVDNIQESLAQSGKMELLISYLSDMLWACQILAKLDSLTDFVHSWVETSENIVKLVEGGEFSQLTEAKLKVLEVTGKLLEAIGYGTVILSTEKRLKLIKVWLPFTRVVKFSIDSSVSSDEDKNLLLKVDDELWQSLESSFVSIVLTLPSDDQAKILTEWLENKHVRYPDLTEAFEVWCYRSKVAKRRLAMLEDNHQKTNSV